MADDLRRKLLLKQMGSASDIIGSPLDANNDESQDTVGDLPFEGSMGNTSHSSQQHVGDGSNGSAPKPAWNEYFNQNKAVILEQRGFIFNTYFTQPKLANISEDIPVFIFHHGAGSSGLSFANLSKDLHEKLDGKCVTFAFDARGHGQTRPIDSQTEVKYDLITFIEDFVAVVENFCSEELTTATAVSYSFIYVGHSLGGSICTSSYSYLPTNLQKKVLGVAMLDIVEEAAILALQKVNQFLQRTPNVFSSCEAAIDWYIQHGLCRCRSSAEISIPALFHITKSQKAVRITNLKDFEPFWNTWFKGLSHGFVSLPCSKLLLLAGNENLDKELIIGQMQGKYQLVVFQECGHFLQEDSPIKTAITLYDFYQRNNYKNVTIRSNWGSNK